MLPLIRETVIIVMMSVNNVQLGSTYMQALFFSVWTFILITWHTQVGCEQQSLLLFYYMK